MSKEKLIKYIQETYGAQEEHPWTRYPDYAVFRHKKNKKWFALVMKIPDRYLGLEEDREVEVITVKADPVLIGSLLAEKGFYPAYHMNKTNWITILLDECEGEKIKNLLAMSFDLTKNKKRK